MDAAGFDALIEAKLIAMGGLTRRISDHTRRWDAIPSGTTKFQLRVSEVNNETHTSRDRFFVARVEIWFYHYLADVSTERPYTLGTGAGEWVTITQTVLKSSWWTSISGVRQLAGEEVGDKPVDPEVNNTPERGDVGNVISSSILVEAQLVN